MHFNPCQFTLTDGVIRKNLHDHELQAAEPYARMMMIHQQHLSFPSYKLNAQKT